MSAPAKLAVYVRDLETDELIHTMQIRYAPGSSQARRAVEGLERRIDLERFYVDAEDFDNAAEAAKEGRPDGHKA